MSRLYQRREVLAFLQDAKEQPEDDAPRLVLADWLEEQGDCDRAEFVRLQCRLAPGSAWPIGDEHKPAAVERVEELLALFGGGWLGSLWPIGGSWHRGLLAVDLDHRTKAEDLFDVLPWIDTVWFEVTGRDAFLRAAAVLTAGSLNHATLALRRPFRQDHLLDLLGGLVESPSLRTLTFRWAPGMGKHHGSSAILGLSSDFFTKVLRELPVGQHLTHFASSLTLTADQADVLRACSVEPVPIPSRHWMHRLTPVAFRR